MSKLITKPMLAVAAVLDELRYPLYSTPKLDGIRCVTLPNANPLYKCLAVSRKWKPIKNEFTRDWLEEYLPAGLDGELVVMVDGKVGSFQACSSGVMKSHGQPDFRFMVFDHVGDDLEEGYMSRINRLRFMRLPRGRVELVMPTKIANREELDAYEEAALAEGYEGVMVRSENSPYKCGRSTVREGWLLKIKRFEYGEARITGTYEGMTNQNEKLRDAFGHAKRSTAKAGKVGRGELGGFNVVDLATGAKFDVGYNSLKGLIPSSQLWEERETLIGKLIRYKFQPTGVKDAPRFPGFAGFRDEDDMS